MKKMTAKRSGHTKRKKAYCPLRNQLFQKKKVDRFVYPREKGKKEGVSKSGFSVT